MKQILLLLSLLCFVISSCTSVKQASAVQTDSAESSEFAQQTSQSAAQAQISQPETSLPVTGNADFHAADALKTLETPQKSNPEGLASTNRKILSSELKKPLGLSKVALKMVEKQITKAIKKRRPAQQDGTILGLRPILFFALVAVLAGVILLFVAGKSQFFSLLTVVLLIGGLLVSLAAFLDLI